MNEIIDQIWQLEWYQVLWIAIVDDFILLVKLWPCFTLVILGAILMFVFVRVLEERAWNEFGDRWR